VLRWLRESGEVERGLLLVGRLFKFWNVRGYGIEGLAHVDAFLSLPGASRRTFGRATALNAASWLANGHGDPTRSVPLSEEACAIFEEHGDHAHLAWALLGRGIGHAKQGNDEQARVDWERALLLFQEVGNNAYIARVLVQLGEIEHRRGDLDRERALAEEALALARVGEHLLVMALALGALGVVAEQSGDDSWAVALYRERLDIAHLLGLPRHIADAIEQFAGIAFRHGQLERAVRLFGASSVIRDRTGRRRSQQLATRMDDALRALRDSLADATLQAAWAEGRALSLDAAIEYALSDEGDALPEPANEAASILTRRELDVLRLIVDGKSNQEIAGDLFISPNTVTTHVANIMNKLGLDSRTAVATWAVRNGIA
jgi:DNA-binding CsgD family transcriptional regulator/tetratricopeptide (TPR) repeat protein